MSRALIILVFGALWLFASVDDEWKELYGAAIKAAAQKDYVKAEVLYARALHDAEIFGKDDPRVASTLQGRATMFRSEKKLTEAEEDARRAVAIYFVNPGPASIEYGEVEFLTANILMDGGRYQPALDAVLIALPVFEQNLGPDSPAMIDSTCLYGDALRLVKRFASAEKPLKRCADMRSDNGGIGTADFGDAANSLAIVYQHTGNLKDADRYFTYAAKIREQSLGLQSPELAETLEAHAVLLRQLGRTDEAKKKEKLAAVIRRSAKK